ncbi:MAG: PRC-barrel domain-containing protein [Alkalimonas sp.]|nr:PRC-barrel domain-containing protein [Alkalimonas sp.]
MNNETSDTLGMFKESQDNPGARLIGTGTLVGNDVYNLKEESLGTIKEIMVDVAHGKISYAVLSFGSFLGMGEKLFAVPWNALTLDNANNRLVLNVDKARLSDAPGFDKKHWPDMADKTWAKQIDSYYAADEPRV